MAFLAGGAGAAGSALGTAATAAGTAASTFGAKLLQLMANPTVGNLFGGTTFGGSQAGKNLSEMPIRTQQQQQPSIQDKMSTLLDLSQLIR